jgi:PIN domain nuclease of toxin-antitoxin system
MITLDTHVIIWDALKPEKISPKAREVINLANDSGEIIIVDISLWEIAMLMKKKRLKVDVHYNDFIKLIREANSYVVQSITAEIAERSVSIFSQIAVDPVESIICAVSQILNAPLVTADTNLGNSDSIKTIW